MLNQDENQNTRSGFVAVLGLPNAGKSTLVNALVGAKVSIVSRKAQTTRTAIRGIVMTDNAQIILVDTPGLLVPDAQKKRAKLEAAMQRAATDSLADAEGAMLVIDASARNKIPQLRAFLESLPDGLPKDTIAVLNKVDLLKKEDLLKTATEISSLFAFKDIYMISASTGDGVGDVANALAALVPEGPYLYDPEQISDLPVRLLLAELTREQIFHFLHDEIPYGAHVMTDDVETKENGVVHVTQRVIVARDTHKGMVIGKGGQTLKKIGSHAREEMEHALEQKVFLNLQVAVDPNWTEKKGYYALWSLRTD
jgi:GTP-binding protein Era